MSLPAPPDTVRASPADEAVRYRVRHSSTYRYGQVIMLAHHLLHLTPRAAPSQRILSFRMDVEPKPAIIADHSDYFLNPTTYFEMHEAHMRLGIRTEIEVEVDPPSLSPLAAGAPWETIVERLAVAAATEARAASAFGFASPMIPVSAELRDFALASFTPGRSVGEAAMDLTNRIYDEFTFDPKATTIGTPVAEVLKNRRGVCQDFAHLQIGCLRSLGLAARYVSGYLRTIPPAGKPRAVGADASHAWLSVWCGGDLWLDLDPTNGRPGSTDLITLAWGRDYSDVSPSRGIILGGSIQYLTVEVDVAAEEHEPS